MVKAKGGELSYINVEVCIAARIMVEALKRGGDASREALIRALETIKDVSLGGFPVFLRLTTLTRHGLWNSPCWIAMGRCDIESLCVIGARLKSNICRDCL